jgi:hypothetical protein
MSNAIDTRDRICAGFRQECKSGDLSTVGQQISHGVNFLLGWSW